MTEQLYGRRPVFEMLQAGRRRVFELLVAHGISDKTGAIDQILSTARSAGLTVKQRPRRDLDRLAANHQGVVARVSPYVYSTLEGILGQCAKAERAPLLLLLDLLQDPQNFGSLLRTAEAVGVDGVIIPERRAVGVTPAVVNASAGAVEHLAVARVTNLARNIDELKQQDFWVVGLEAAPEAQRYDQADLLGPLALVVGSEGSGLRRLVREKCDFLVRLPMRGRVASLNASVAGSVALYEVDRQRRVAGRH
jgi:23S rRNA (guanosine2251-2'-O)-methyltransferase